MGTFETLERIELHGLRIRHLRASLGSVIDGSIGLGVVTVIVRIEFFVTGETPIHTDGTALDPQHHLNHN